MRFRVLGPLEVEDDAGDEITVPGQRPRALLTALLLDPGAVVPVERLIDALWGEEPPAAPVNAMQQVVARLRARLASAAGERGAEHGAGRLPPGGASRRRRRRAVRTRLSSST